jgi:hypothetical protein
MAARTGPGSTVQLSEIQQALAGAPSEDAVALLRLALEKHPNSPAGRAARRAAETSLVRYARALRKRARSLSGAARTDLEKRASNAYFRAILARKLPDIVNVVGSWQQTTPPPSSAPEVLPQPCGDTFVPTATAPDAPTGVVATPRAGAAVVTWAPRSPEELVSNHTITPYIGGTAQAPTTVGAVSSATIVGLANGTSYTFTVRATNHIGTSVESSHSNAVTPVPLPLGAPGTPLSLVLPAFSSDPMLLIDPLAEQMRTHVAAPAAVAAKWRYEHLKELAVVAARDAMRFDGHIERLMSMALTKLSSAELLLNPTLIAAVQDLQRAADVLATPMPETDSLLEPLGQAAAQALLLAELIAWLTEHGPVSFYVGLFEAIINDLAAVVPLFGSATDFGHTKTYLQHVFDTNLGGLRDAIVQMAQDIRARLDAEVDGMIAPLRAAVDKLIQGTSQAMDDVFQAFDLPVLMTPPKFQGGTDVANVDPLKAVYEQLQAQIDGLANTIKQKIETALDPILSGAGGDLFKTIVITFLVLPILAFLLIALAGGPISAALLAAVVLVAAEELLRLLLRWLGGPVLERVDQLKHRLAELVGRLQQFFANQAALVQNATPVPVLEILAGELRELRDFMPEAFLNETAQLLGEARDVVMRTATALGLAAEQAVGQESATAFDAMPYDFDTHLPAAAQAPGGGDPSRFAGAALIANLGRLEQQRTAIQDGKELEFTHRLSLARLLGGATGFTEFVTRREAVVHLTGRDLLDRLFPGVYRAQIKEIRVTGLFGAPVGALVQGIPITVTHLGESRTRIKRSANPFAPPLQLPTCCPSNQIAFTEAVAGDDVLTNEILRAFSPVHLYTKGDYFIAFLVLLLFGVPHPEEVISTVWRKACLENLLDSLERLVRETSCNVVRPESFVASARALLESYTWAPIIFAHLMPSGPGDVSNIPVLGDAAAQLATLLRQDVVDQGKLVLPGLVRTAGEAWCEGVAEFRKHIAKWGEATLEEDPDPQVRSLGFGTLVRKAPQETVIFYLFPEGPPANVRADAPIGSADGPPAAPASTLQYRPLENRGLDGRLLLRLETLGDDGVSQLSDSLTDLVLEIVIKACYDADLAQTLRSSRRQTATGLQIVSNLSAIPVLLTQPDSAVSTAAGISARRTVHFSLRAHRDRTLQIWTAAVQAQPLLTATLAGLLPGKAMLNRDEPFQPLTPISGIRFDLTSATPANSVAALQDLAGALHVSPLDLGFNSSVLAAGRTLLEQARLESIGIAIIPMPGGVRGENDPSTTDPLGLTLQVPPPLDVLLPGFGTTAAFPDRLRMTVAVSNPPTLADLFAATPAPAVMLNLPAVVFAPAPLLYEVIFSLTYTVPVLETATHIAGLS